MSSTNTVVLKKDDFNRTVKCRVISIEKNSILNNYRGSNKPMSYTSETTITVETPTYPNDRGYTVYRFSNAELPLHIAEKISIGDIIELTFSITPVIVESPLNDKK